MKNNILWVFIHPIRSGGNTLIEFIKKEIPEEQIFMASKFRYGLPNTSPFNKEKTRFALGHATYYGMHNLSPEKETRYVIFLRDPAERIVSYYNAKMSETKKRIPFEKWYKNQTKDDLINFLDLKYRGHESTRTPVPKFLMPIIKRLNYRNFFLLQSLALKFFKKNKKSEKKKLENAKRLLDACWFVGITEKSDKDFKFLLKKMGFRNPQWVNDGASKKIFRLTNELRNKIYHDHSMDFELYKYALELNEKKKKLLK